MQQHRKGQLTGEFQWYFLPSKTQVEFYDLKDDAVKWKNLANHPKYKLLIKQY
jgi:hypothetical protein